MFSPADNCGPVCPVIPAATVLAAVRVAITQASNPAL